MVSYDSVVSAEHAIDEMSGFKIGSRYIYLRVHEKDRERRFKTNMPKIKRERILEGSNINIQTTMNDEISQGGREDGR